MNYKDVVSSIAYEIAKYHYVNNKDPDVIFMTRPLMSYLIENDPYVYFHINNYGMLVEFRGIKVKDYTDDEHEYRYYLAGNPGEFHWFPNNHEGNVVNRP